MSKKFPAAKTETKENDDEMYFTWYLDELIQFGYLKSYDREPETLIVLPAYEHTREKHYVNKKNEEDSFNLLQPITYTYDFRLIWHHSATYVFTEIFTKGKPFKFGEPTFISHYIKMHGETEIISYVDVKPHVSAARFGGGKLASFYTFPFIQKFLMVTRGLYINKAIPKNQGNFGINTCLFAKTFTPNRYKFTDQAGQLRKLKWRITPITSYVQRQQAIIDNLLKQEEKKEAKNKQQTLL